MLSHEDEIFELAHRGENQYLSSQTRSQSCRLISVSLRAPRTHSFTMPIAVQSHHFCLSSLATAWSRPASTGVSVTGGTESLNKDPVAEGAGKATVQYLKPSLLSPLCLACTTLVYCLQILVNFYSHKTFTLQIPTCHSQQSHHAAQGPK
jgi:hypothetical protein